MLQPVQPQQSGAVDVLEPPRCGLATLAPDGVWEAADDAMGALLGVAPADLVGRAAHRELLPEQAERVDAAVQLLRHGPATVRLTGALRQAGGDPRGVQLELAAAAEDPQRIELRLAADDPAADSPAAAAAIATASAAHDAEMQQYWTYGISHDLRASLRAVESFARRLDDHQAERLDAEGRVWLDRIRAASAQACGLTEAMLEFLRVESQPLQRRPVDISLLVDWTCAELQDADPGREAVIDLQPDIAVLGDERQLKQMLGHLLRNAWRFSSSRERVEIRVDALHTGQWVTLRIHDRGLGFDPGYADKLFVPFRRLHGAEDGAGHGLGLATVKRIVDRHGGRIRAESVPGSGSTFLIELPAVEVAEQT